MKDDSASELRTSLFRQRRSLIAVSIVLAVYVAAGIKLRDISVLGTSFEVTRPGLIQLGLWLVWGYFALRFYQVRRDMADDTPEHLRLSRLQLYAVGRAREAAMRDPLPGDAEYLKNDDYRFFFSGEHVTEAKEKSLVVVHDLTLIAKNGGKQFSFIGVPREVAPSSTVDRIRAYWWVAIHTRYVTEYDLPVLLGAAPVITAVGVWIARVAP